MTTGTGRQRPGAAAASPWPIAASLFLCAVAFAQQPGPVVPDPASLSAQRETRAVDEVIDTYVREGLKSNLSLAAETLDVEHALAGLDAARSQYAPILALDARYTRAWGGRTLDLPLGTLLNPVYGTLNELLVSQGRPAPFVPVGDQTIYFQRQREQDTRLSVRQPLYAPAIPAAVRVQRAQLEALQYARLALARRLKRDVTVAYLEWLQSTHAVGIQEASVALLEENLRVSDSLYRNGKVTQDQVLRARAELLAVQQQLNDARNGVNRSRSYLNFLLNRDLDTPLESARADIAAVPATPDLAVLREQALGKRPELAQLDHQSSAAQAQISLANATRLPGLSLGVDGGIDDERYRFGGGSNYGMVSLLLHWQFFDGGATAAAVRGARAQLRRTAVERDEAAQQIRLEVEQALDALATSADSLATAQARASAAHAAFRIASRKRDEGVINQVEFIDARSALTGAELNLNLTRFELLARRAELDYATAAGNLPLAGIGTDGPSAHTQQEALP
ncbi:MAG: TolC family protein [Proteobacteria bacterium]|nr:TolC family protein [Pseudomonadota bacterium]